MYDDEVLELIEAVKHAFPEISDDIILEDDRDDLNRGILLLFHIIDNDPEQIFKAIEKNNMDDNKVPINAADLSLEPDDAIQISSEMQEVDNILNSIINKYYGS